MQRKIIITGEGRKLVEQAVKEDRKIAAIKAARLHGRVNPPDPNRSDPNSVGLKEAKHAIEHKYWPDMWRGSTPCAVIDGGYKIKKVIVEIAGEGDVELDIETLQMRFLQDLEALGLDEVQRLLELTEYIKKWQD